MQHTSMEMGVGSADRVPAKYWLLSGGTAVQSRVRNSSSGWEEASELLELK